MDIVIDHIYGIDITCGKEVYVTLCTISFLVRHPPQHSKTAPPYHQPCLSLHILQFGNLEFVWRDDDICKHSLRIVIDKNAW